MENLNKRNQICDDLGLLFTKLNKIRSKSSKRSLMARGKLLDQIGHNLDALRRLDLFVALACH